MLHADLKKIKEDNKMSKSGWNLHFSTRKIFWKCLIFSSPCVSKEWLCQIKKKPLLTLESESAAGVSTLRSCCGELVHLGPDEIESFSTEEGSSHSIPPSLSLPVFSLLPSHAPVLRLSEDHTSVGPDSSDFFKISFSASTTLIFMLSVWIYRCLLITSPCLNVPHNLVCSVFIIRKC